MARSFAGGGAGAKSFFEDIICGNVDVYFAGHDHSLQWLTSTCAGTELVVDGDRLTIEMIGADGTLLFSRDLTKP